MKFIKSAGLLFLTLTCAFGQTTVYVATTGSDTDGNGSEVNPYLTISNGVAQASAAARIDQR